jgi:hypothetical protein
MCGRDWRGGGLMLRMVDVFFLANQETYIFDVGHTKTYNKEVWVK